MKKLLSTVFRYLCIIVAVMIIHILWTQHEQPRFDWSGDPSWYEGYNCPDPNCLRSPILFDITEFGAVPDDDLDDTAGMDLAITAAGIVQKAGYHGIVTVPSGSYTMGPIVVDESVTLFGDPNDRPVLNFNDPSEFAINIAADGVTLIGLSFMYEPDPNTVAIIIGEGSDGIVITNNHFEYKAEPTFEDLLDALCWVESRCDADAVCPDGCCVGAYQITEIYVDDVNRIYKKIADSCGSEVYPVYTYADRWDKDHSRQMTATLIQYYGKGDIELMARSHRKPGDPYGEGMDEYWEKVKARMEQ